MCGLKAPIKRRLVIETLQEKWNELLQSLIEWGASPAFYGQAAIIGVAVFLAIAFAPILRKTFREPQETSRLLMFRQFFFELRVLLLPFCVFIFTFIGSFVGDLVVGQSWLIKIAQGLAVVWLLVKAIRHFIQDPFISLLLKWVVVPLAALKVFGWFDEVMVFLAGMSIELGNIHLSALNVGRGIVFGAILFWLGRHSNDAGKKAIRKNPSLDIGTRELLAKLFEIILYVVLIVVLLQVVGINLTALTVLGGAIGVGLGFGLQQIAANFISGLIILFDRSIKVGDHIQLDEEVFGILREIKMRYAVVETYEGKEVMIPNETFITSIFTNWSGKDDKQRYDLTFSVAYDTDLHALFDMVREVVASHPQVISGDDVPIEEQPDAEIDSFDDSGISVLVEFWMHGIDDGRNRVDADLKLMIWDAMRERGFRMPFPQREVRILGDQRD